MASEKAAGESAPGNDEVRPVNEKTQLEQDVRDKESMDQVISSAKAATDKEQNMTLLQGIKLYPKAIAWSMLISTCIIMEGYDVCLINNFCEFLASWREYWWELTSL